MESQYQHRQPHESMQQFRGRLKRELNAANDALNLQVGEPIQIGGRRTRFQLRLIDRVSPSKMKRLEGEDLILFLAEEKAEQDRQASIRAHQEERDAFYARPEAQDADAIRYILEDRIQKVVDRLTPAEWAELRKRLET